MTVTKDGVTVASAINVKDPTEDLAINLMKEAAGRTASEAGDGTTTSIVLAEAFIEQATHLLKDRDIDVIAVTREMQSLCEESIEMLRQMSRKMTKKTIEAVATISANNDKVIGKLIADTYKDVGKHGVVTVTNSEGPQTYAEVVKGILRS